MNNEELEKELNEYQELKNKAFEKERQFVQKFYQLERDTFRGLTYHEYINTIKKEIQVSEKIFIKIDTYNIWGYYQINENVKIVINPTIYAEDTFVRGRIEYKTKDSHNIPKKCEKEYKELVEECFKHKIVNPSEKYKKQFNITMY